jgi:tetratricopeptide (TPR) repeat protein
MYQRALELQPDDIRITNAIARHHLKYKEFDKTEEYINAIMEKRPNYFPARMVKAELLLAQRQFAEAIELLNQIIKEEPNSARAHYFMGLAHIGKGESRLAKTDLGKTLELSPNHIKSRLLLAGIYLRERDFAAAQKESQQILALDPKNYPATLISGNADLFQKNIANAQKTYESLIELQPDNPVGYFRLGYLQRLLQQYDPALTNFEKALAFNPRLMDVFANIVAVHIAQKDVPTALRKCDQKLAEFQDQSTISAIVHNLKGTLYLVQKNKARAEASFQAALKANPNYLQPYYALAGIYLSENKTDQAVAQYQSALATNPKQTRAHMVLGTIFDSQKQFDQSKKHYRAALDINPEFAPAANNLAFVLADEGQNLDEALGFARMAKEKLPEDPNVMDTLGWVYYKKGLYDSAISEFSDSLEKIPGNAIVNYHLGMAFYKKGDRDNAKLQMEKALSLNQNFPGADEAKRVLAEM